MDKVTTSWLDFTTTLYNHNSRNYGRPRTFRQILFNDFACDHNYYENINPRYRKKSVNPDEQYYKIAATVNDLENIIQVRKGLIDKAIIKPTLQCYQPSGYYLSKKKGSEILERRLPLLQLDFDNIAERDLELVKVAIFELPFVALVSKSVSGKGLFALIQIAEPEKLKQYANHLFAVFKHYGLPADEGKGQNPSQLRYVSYDANMLIREYPEPLLIKKFYEPPEKKYKPVPSSYPANELIAWGIRQIRNSQQGQRFETVRKVAYTLGGRNTGLHELEDAINNSPQFTREENEFITVAKICFEAGQLKPIAV